MSEWDQQAERDDGEGFMEKSLPAVKFETVGEVHGGTVMKVTKRDDVDLAGNVKRWENTGEPKSVYVFELDGVKSLWVRGNMITAIREAVGAAKLKSPVGARIEVKYYGDGIAKPGMHAPKLFMARVLRADEAFDTTAQQSPPRQPQAAAQSPW